MGNPPQKKITTIYLTRHCEYQNSDNFIALRHPRVSLSAAGKESAAKLAQFFQKKFIHAIYTSPLLRTRQTAQIIGKHLHISPKTSRSLIEVYSPLDGISRIDFDLLGGLIYNHPSHRKSGEKITAVYNRVLQFVHKMVNRHPGQNIILVTHGDPIMLLTYGLLDNDLSLHLKKARPYIPKGGVMRLVFRGQLLDSFQQVFPLIS